MRLLLLFSFFFSIQSCQSGKNEKVAVPAVSQPDNIAISAENTQLPLHSILVLEIIQVDNYTYIRAREGTAEYWLAAPTIQTKIGDTLYYDGGMQMTNFESKELKRKFDKILFVDRISATPGNTTTAETEVKLPADHVPVGDKVTKAPATGSSKDTTQQSIKIEPAKNGLSIATVLKDAKSYQGKKIIVKGKITKYTAGVMGKNWVHIQDGSSYNGKFEIVITTSATLIDGEVATFEGVLTLNKDLGYGYFFEVLMEDAQVIR
jgi:hypothetical protein